MSDANDVAFIGFIVWEFPQLMESFGEHLDDNRGEVLPHVFMGQIERWAEGLVANDRALLSEFLVALSLGYEKGYSSVRNLIEVSFVEQLPYPDEPNAAIRELLPPRLKCLLRHGS